jgi:hypothetical protein
VFANVFQCLARIQGLRRVAGSDVERWPCWTAASAGGVERMTRFWGDDSWKQAAYAESAQGGLFETEVVKQGNEAIVEAFRKRLKEVARFSFVPDPLPMRNSTNARYCRTPFQVERSQYSHNAVSQNK